MQRRCQPDMKGVSHTEWKKNSKSHSKTQINKSRLIEVIRASGTSLSWDHAFIINNKSSCHYLSAGGPKIGWQENFATDKCLWTQM